MWKTVKDYELITANMPGTMQITIHHPGNASPGSRPAHVIIAAHSKASVRLGIQRPASSLTFGQYFSRKSFRVLNRSNIGYSHVRTRGFPLAISMPYPIGRHRS